MKATYELTREAVEWLIQHTVSFGLDATMQRLSDMGVIEMDRDQVCHWLATAVTAISMTNHARQGGWRQN